MRSPFPKRKSTLSELAKAVVAAKVLLDVRDKRLNAAAAGLRLREAIGLQWTFLSAVQYLSGKSAIAAITALPADWMDAGRSKPDLLCAILIATDIVANVRPDGEPLCASDLAKKLKGLANAGV
jgi:hypothetical protein